MAGLPPPAAAARRATARRTRSSPRPSPASGRCCGSRRPPTWCTSRSAAPRSGNALVLCPTAAMAATIGDRLRRAGVPVALHPARLGAGRGRGHGGRHPRGGLGTGRRPGERRGARRARRGPPAGAGADLACPRRRDRAGAPGRGALRAHQPVPDAGGAAVGRAPRRRPRPRPGGLARGGGGRPARGGPAPRPALRRAGSAAPRGRPGAVRPEPDRSGQAARLPLPAASWPAARGARRRWISPRTSCVCPRCGAAPTGGVPGLRGEPVSNARAGVHARARGAGGAGRGAGGRGDRRPTADVPRERVVVGTEAVLQRIDRADAVAFLDLDQELLAPRYRAAEQALAWWPGRPGWWRPRRPPGARAAGRLLLQTRLPEHEVVQAAVHADRRGGRRPSGPGASCSGSRRSARWPRCRGRRRRPSSTRWAADRRRGGRRRRRSLVVRAPDHPALCDALAATTRPPGRLRIEVDPLRLTDLRRERTEVVVSRWWWTMGRWGWRAARRDDRRRPASPRRPSPPRGGAAPSGHRGRPR